MGRQAGAGRPRSSITDLEGTRGGSEVGGLLQELPETGQGLLTVWGSGI